MSSSEEDDKADDKDGNRQHNGEQAKTDGLDEIERDGDRDFWMTAEEALISSVFVWVWLTTRPTRVSVVPVRFLMKSSV